MVKVKEKKLTAAQYWEWRTTISEMETAKEKFQNARLSLNLLQKEAEMVGVRTQLFLRTRMEASKGELEKAQAEYERFKKVLEDSLGMSLKNTVIDDITFEVKDLPDDKLTPTEAKE